MEKFQIVIIGSGPGGYVAAIRASQLGYKTAIIERYSVLGGTCLNVGCIPSKALLDSSELFYLANKKFKTHGIALQNLSVDFKQMIKRKSDVVSQTSAGINYLMKKNKITVFNGHASFENKNTIVINNNDKKTSIEAEKIIIATGSKPSSLKGIEIDKKKVITSTEALGLEEIPKSMIIIGGGVIGLELGSVYARLGTKIQVIEYAENITPMLDLALSKELKKSLEALGMEFYLNHQVTSCKNSGNIVNVVAKNNDNEVKFNADICLVSVGRMPYTNNLGLDKVGVKLDSKGFILTNSNLETSVPNIYAIGDVIGGAMLAHKAEEEGVFVVDKINGLKSHLNYHLIPNVVYTWPEVSSIGFNENELKENNISYKIGFFPFSASGRARASMDHDFGFVRVYAHKDTDEILGVHIIGPRAADIIAEVLVAMDKRLTALEVGSLCHPHPTFSEALKEACLDASSKRAVNI